MTAYEMRISDWSSDVGSSDHATRCETSPSRCATATRSGRACWERHPRAGERRWSQRSRPPAEIGRASCRERVSQLRVDLGGRRIIKIKCIPYTQHMNVTYQQYLKLS